MCTIFNKYAWLYNPIVRLFQSHKKYADKIKDVYKLNQETKILDVGGGTGIMSEYLANKVKEITILDPAERMMSKSKVKNIHKVKGFAQSISFEDKTFDMVYCVDSFHHFVNGYKQSEYSKVYNKCVNELLRVLKDNGSLILIEINTKKFLGKFVMFFENKIMRWGSKFFSKNELADLFSKQDVNIEFIGLDGMCYLAKISKK